MQPIIFQIIDWAEYNDIVNKQDNSSASVQDDDSESDELEKELGFGKEESESYKIRLYGRTQQGTSVVVNVNNYHPFFYIKVPIDWTSSKILSLIGYIKSKIGRPNIINGFKTFDVLTRKDLYGFTGYKDFKFVRLIFYNMKSYKAFENWIGYNKISNNLLSKYPFKLSLYESNIKPFIRCMHIRKINACGWVQISKYEKYDSTYSYCGSSIQTDWTNLEPFDLNIIEKFVTVSWDIECMSLSGNFPQAIDPEDKSDFDQTIKTLVQKIKTKNKYKKESDIIQMIYHNPKLYKEYGEYEFKKSGDPIIQIGLTFSYYGEPEPFAKHLISLNGCDKIKGFEDAEIHSFNDEKKVLLTFTKLIQKMDPDIVTGWNIIGFDFPYVYDRAVKLKILDKVSELSRICGEKSEFKESMLSSSALGDNILKYFDMGGRIIIDMMKERQREAKLDSYKLDSVASTYIKEKLVLYEANTLEKKFIIYTPSVYGIKASDYINVTWDDGLSDDKHDIKYKINNLEKVKQEDLDKIIKTIETHPRYNDFEFKKPKSLYKLEVDGIFPEELFDVEDGNECLWHSITKTKQNYKLYFQIEGYAHSHTHTDEQDEQDKQNKDVTWIDMKFDNTIIPIKGNKIFWAHAKDDISPKELFALYKGSDADRGKIAKYCIMDCILVAKLMEKLQVLNNNIGMANVCGVPLSYIFMRGQGVKIFSLVSKKCRELGFLIPKITPNDKNRGKNPEAFDPAHPHKNYKKIKKANESDSDSDSDNENVGYEGATVFPPVKGIHYEPIPVLDYASLYPRSMIYMNISHETYVNNPSYDNLPDFEYKTATYNNNDGTTTTCRFAKKKDGTSGVLCIILEELLKKRSETKKLMEKANTEGMPFLAAIYDGLQLAYKVTANSLYGQVGAPTSPIYMKELAASTTSTGRKMLEFSRDFIEGSFGELINSAIHDKNKYYEISKDLYKDVPDKKFDEPKQGRKTMDDFIEYFRNKINILMSPDYKVKPKVIYGDSVTPDTPIILLNKSTNDVEIKFIKDIGFKWLEYNEFKSDQSGLSEKQQDMSSISGYQVWTDKGWAEINRVIRHKTNKRIYEVITSQAYVKVTSDHSLLDLDGNQLKPGECIQGQTKLLHNREFEGFKRLHGNYPHDYIEYIVEKYGYHPDSIGTINFNFAYNELDKALSTYYACKAFGYYVKIHIEKFTNDFKRIHIISSKVRPENYSDFDKILEINDLGFIDDYVYDLETTIGHFHAGVGSLIVKNTDSVFFTPKIHNIKTKQIKTDRAALRVCIEIGKLAGDTICKILPEPEEQVYEKTLWPFIILTKKRYVGNLYEDDDSHFKQKSMGIVLKRRDNAKIVKIVVGGIVDYILNGKPGISDVIDRNKGALEYTRTLLKKILQGKYPIDKYIITKTLRANYKGTKLTTDKKGELGQKGSWFWDDVKCPLAHVALCQRMAKRDPGNKPESNDRIPYVYIVPKGKVNLQGDRIDDPKHVTTNNIELDYLFYITNQIMKPSKQFIEHIATNPDKLFENYINKEINRRKKINSVSEYVNGYEYNKSETNNSSNDKFNHNLHENLDENLDGNLDGNSDDNLDENSDDNLDENSDDNSDDNLNKKKSIKSKNLTESKMNKSTQNSNSSKISNSINTYKDLKKDSDSEQEERLINKIKSNKIKSSLTINI